MGIHNSIFLRLYFGILYGAIGLGSIVYLIVDSGLWYLCVPISFVCFCISFSVFRNKPSKDPIIYQDHID